MSVRNNNNGRSEIEEELSSEIHLISYWHSDKFQRDTHCDLRDMNR